MDKDVEIAEWGDWKARDYIEEFYAQVDPDSTQTVEFLVEALKRLPNKVTRAMDFGVGPAMYTVFSLTAVADEIHLSDFLPDNRTAIQMWKDNAPNAYDWVEFTKDALKLEGIENPTDEQAREREAETRAKITEIEFCDASLEDPLGPERRGYYPLVATHYCAEGATNDKPAWRRYMDNIISLIEPGGMLVVSAVEQMKTYPVGDLYYPAANVRASELLAFFEDHDFENIDLRIRETPFRAEQGFLGILFASGFKPK